MRLNPNYIDYEDDESTLPLAGQRKMKVPGKNSHGDWVSRNREHHRALQRKYYYQKRNGTDSISDSGY